VVFPDILGLSYFGTKKMTSTYVAQEAGQTDVEVFNAVPGYAVQLKGKEDPTRYSGKEDPIAYIAKPGYTEGESVRPLVSLSNSFSVAQATQQPALEYKTQLQSHKIASFTLQ
jgi:hypothetical protein